jgi:hypothetical protein
MSNILLLIFFNFFDLADAPIVFLTGKQIQSSLKFTGKLTLGALIMYWKYLTIISKL